MQSEYFTGKAKHMFRFFFVFCCTLINPASSTVATGGAVKGHERSGASQSALDRYRHLPKLDKHQKAQSGFLIWQAPSGVCRFCLLCAIVGFLVCVPSAHQLVTEAPAALFAAIAAGEAEIELHSLIWTGQRRVKQVNHTTNEQGKRQQVIKRASRSGEYLRWRAQVADAYRAAGMVADGDLFDSCSDPTHFFKLNTGDSVPAEAVNVVACSSDPAHLSKAVCPSCQLRTCPDCAHRESARLLARYMPAMQQYMQQPYKPGWRFKKIVFTSGISVRAGDVQQQIEKLYAALRKVFEKALKLRNQGAVDFSDIGLVIAHEFGPNGLKLHFHGIYYGPYIPQILLSHLWDKLTGWRIVSIESIGKTTRAGDLPDAVAEVVKYTTKFWKREKSGKVVFIEPDLVPIIHKALQGTRRVRSWGLFYDLDIEDEPAACPDCGAPLTLLSKSEWDAWSQTGWLPDELRIVLRGDQTLNLIHGNKSPPTVEKIEHKQGILL